jgi:hypothetical protein
MRGFPPVPPTAQHELGVGVSTNGTRYLISEPMPRYLEPPLYVVPPPELFNVARMTDDEVVAYVRSNIGAWLGNSERKFRRVSSGWVRDGDAYLLDYLVAMDDAGNWRTGSCHQDIHVVRSATGAAIGIYAGLGICLL